MDGLYAAFRERAEAVSAEVQRFASRRDAMEFIASFVQKETAGKRQPSAVWADQQLSDAERERLQALGVTCDVTREAAAEAPIGVTEVEWAIANTGTLAGDFTPVARRLASTLPPIHIALVPTSGLLPDLPAVLNRLQPTQIAYISMITGPSRTADIERVLTIGVHGPKRLIIVFADGNGERA